MKTSNDKRVNRMVRRLNRTLQEDVFEGRFSIRMIKKTGFDFCHAVHWYQFELCDSDQPERNEMVFFDQFEILISKKLHRAMNDFIVYSNFWNEIWPKKKSAYLNGKDMCFSCNKYTPYTIRKERFTLYSYPDYTPYSIIGERAYCKKCKRPVNADNVVKRNLARVQQINPNVEQIVSHNFNNI